MNGLIDKVFDRMLMKLMGFLSISLAFWGQPMTPAYADEGPIVIAHRGASGYRPEHTRLSYRLGIEQGADYIEPDLVMTKDGHLVARHDIYLSGTTDVADRKEFADRKRVLEGHEDWFVFDFTLAELKSLKAKQPRPSRGTQYDGSETILTVEEIIALTRDAASNGQKVGLYIEMKRPELFVELGLDPTKSLTRVFNELSEQGIPSYFQCFNGEYLKQLGQHISAPLIWLIEGVEDKETGAYVLEEPIDSFGTDIAGIGINKALLVDVSGTSSGIVADAHRLGFKVHVWTLRDDQVAPMFDTIDDELAAIWALGVDGVFSDFPDTALVSRGRMVAH